MKTFFTTGIITALLLGMPYLASAQNVRVDAEARAEVQSDHKERRQDRHERHQKARVRVQVLIDMTVEEREDFVEEKGEDAIQARLHAFIEKRINHLLSVKARIEANENIDADEQARLIAEVDTEISALEDLDSRVDNASGAALVDVIIDVHAEHENNVDTVRKVQTHHLKARVEHMMEKGGNALERFNNKTEELREEGYDVSVLIDAASTYEVTLGEAKLKADAAVQAFVEAETSDTPGELVERGIALAKEAKKTLKEGIQNLKEAIRTFKASLELEAEASASIN